MTPSLSGCSAENASGVWLIMFFASWPTASTRCVLFSMATTDGSLMTMPSPVTATKVLAVPRSMAMSVDIWPVRPENASKNDIKANPSNPRFQVKPDSNTGVADPLKIHEGHTLPGRQATTSQVGGGT